MGIRRGLDPLCWERLRAPQVCWLQNLLPKLCGGKTAVGGTAAASLGL
jgi:hypothetical protein